MSEGMSDKSTAELYEWQDGIEKRLDRIEEWRAVKGEGMRQEIRKIRCRLEALEAVAKVQQFFLAQVGDEQSYDASQIRKRLNKLEAQVGVLVGGVCEMVELKPDTACLADRQVAVPVVTLQTIATRAQAARNCLNYNTFSSREAIRNLDALLAMTEELLQPLARVELNPEAGGAEAIANEIYPMCTPYEPDYDG